MYPRISRLSITNPRTHLHHRMSKAMWVGICTPIARRSIHKPCVFRKVFTPRLRRGMKLDISRKGILIKLRCVKIYVYVLVVVVGSGVGSGAGSGARSAFSAQPPDSEPPGVDRPLSEPQVMNRKPSTPQLSKSVLDLCLGFGIPLKGLVAVGGFQRWVTPALNIVLHNFVPRMTPV